MRNTTTILFLALISAPSSNTNAAVPLSLYEWTATAQVIVSARNLGTYGKFAEFQVDHVLRGKAATVIKVNVRRANRDRDRLLHKDALKFETGYQYLLLLRPNSATKPGSVPAFELVRGVRGAREIPSEGSAPLIDAVSRFIEIQDQRDDRVKWRQLTEMVDASNLILVEAALHQFVKFRRGDPELLESLRQLLDHPTPELRQRSAELIGLILERHPDVPIPDAGELQNELVARARRDTRVEVRVAATRALDGLGSDSVDDILDEIANEDPDQEVRYAAEKLIYEREQNAEHAAREQAPEGG